MQEDNKKQEKEFLNFTKDKEAVNVYFTREDVLVSDILLGIAATIMMVMKETGKDKETVLKVVNDMIEESNKNKKGEKENGSK